MAHRRIYNYHNRETCLHRVRGRQEKWGTWSGGSSGHRCTSVNDTPRDFRPEIASPESAGFQINQQTGSKRNVTAVVLTQVDWGKYVTKATEAFVLSPTPLFQTVYSVEGRKD